MRLLSDRPIHRIPCRISLIWQRYIFLKFSFFKIIFLYFVFLGKRHDHSPAEVNGGDSKEQFNAVKTLPKINIKKSKNAEGEKQICDYLTKNRRQFDDGIKKHNW